MIGKNITVIVPCLNEIENIPKVIPEVIKFCEKMQFELIIVNDGSIDGTKELLKNYSSESLKVIHHKLNKGYGAAIKTGINSAANEWIITIDADGQHNLEDINKLLVKAEAADADMVVGSRIKQSSTSIYRGIGKFFIWKFSKFFIHHNIRDINSGMKLYKRDLALKYIVFCPDGMSFSDIIFFMFAYNRHLVIEEDITLKKRLYGSSTISTYTALETVMEIVNIVLLFRPIRFFLPLSAFVFVTGIYWAIWTYRQSGQLATGAELLLISSLIVLLMGLITEQITRLRRDIFKI